MLLLALNISALDYIWGLIKYLSSGYGKFFRAFDTMCELLRS